MTRSEILTQANVIINGEREGQYGSPEDSFRKIAGMWSAYLGVPLQEHDVAAMMVLLKIARVAGGAYKEDNWIDIAGYAACGGEVQGNGTVSRA